MQNPFDSRLLLANDLRERQRHDAAGERLMAVEPRDPGSVRRVVGRSLVRLGRRLAAEPSMEPARSR